MGPPTHIRAKTLWVEMGREYAMLSNVMFLKIWGTHQQAGKKNKKKKKPFLLKFKKN